MSAIMLTFIFASCKKNKNTATTLQKIQTKWSVESVIDHEHDPSSLPIDTTTTYLGVATDYVDFRNDGKVYSYFDGSADTSPYTLSGDTTIIINLLGKFKIQSLTDHVLKLYDKEDNPSTSSYFEEYINLKK